MTLQVTLNQNDEERLKAQAAGQNLSVEQYLDRLVAHALADPREPQEPHVVIDPKKGPRISGSRIKVSDIAIEGSYHDRTAEDALQAYPHLTPAQVHAALAYYYDHKEEIDLYIKESGKEFERLRAEAGPSPFETRMRAEGRIP